MNSSRPVPRRGGARTVLCRGHHSRALLRLVATSLAVVTAMLSAACERRLSEEESEAIERWLLCDECTDGEHDAVVNAIGSDAVPRLAGALRGPSPQRLHVVRQRFNTAYDRVAGRTQISRYDYVTRLLSNYRATYQKRSAIALRDIGTAAAREELREALDRSGARGYRDDVIEEIAAGLGSSLVIVAGNNQTISEGLLARIDPTVRVLDARGDSVVGAAVTFTVTGGGGTAGAEAISDDSGYASPSGWTMGPPGPQQLTASLPGGASAVFDATSRAVDPAIARQMFYEAYVGSGNVVGVVLTSGMFADEWVHSGTGQDFDSIDARTVDSETGRLEETARALHWARRELLHAADRVSAGSAARAEMWALAGYAHLALAENWCSGVPVGDRFGQPPFAPTTTLLDRAITLFTQSIATATAAGAAEVERLALVGRARAHLNRDNLADATASAAAVPNTWAWRTDHEETDPARWNGVFEWNVNQEHFSLADNEGGAGLDFRNGDPRIDFERTERGGDVGADNTTPQFDLLKYSGRNDSLVLASGTEARLIEAEVALRNGDLASWLAYLNQLRSPEGIAPLTDPGTVPARVDLMFRERAFWLFATGHRHGDLRRLVRYYGRPTNVVFPTGLTERDIPYGKYFTLPSYICIRRDP